MTVAKSVVRTPSSGRGRPDYNSQIPTAIDAAIPTRRLFLVNISIDINIAGHPSNANTPGETWK